MLIQVHYCSSLQKTIIENNYWATSQENLSSGFPIRVDLNRPAQPQKLARGLKFRIYKLQALYYLGCE